MDQLRVVSSLIGVPIIFGKRFKKTQLEERFFKAADTSNLKEVTRCLELGVDPNTRFFDNITALHIAAMRGNLALGIRLLACKDLDLNLINKHSYTPLLLACISRQGKFMKILLKNGADVNKADRFGNTPLHTTVRLNAIDMTMTLFKYKPEMNIRNAFNDTPLSMAILENKSLAMAKLLLKHNASIDVDDEDNMHMFLSCCLQCNSREDLYFVQLLLKEGVDINIRDKIGGRTALHFTGITGYVELALLLLQNGANLALKDILNRKPYEVAYAYNNLPVAYLLEEYEFSLQMSLDPRKIYETLSLNSNFGYDSD